MASTGFHCDLCNIFFHKKNEYDKHCQGKKHKVKEVLAHEHEAANRRLYVRGIDWMRDPQAFLHSYFKNFGKLNGISLRGKQGSTFAVVEFQDQDSISRALNVNHRIERHVLNVKRYKYQPQHWERNKLTNEEFQEEEKAKQAQVRDKMMEVLLTAESVSCLSLCLTPLFTFTSPSPSVCLPVHLFTFNSPSPSVCCRVYQFGSSVNGFGAKGCDLDLFLDIDDDSTSAKSKIKKLSQILLKSPSVSKTLVIPSNRCPVVRFLHKSSNIKCDLSINNRKALHNSYLLRLYSTDPRVHKLVSIVRLWARSQGLTSTSGGAHLFTSYAITLIVLYFLMHRKEKLIPLVCEVENCVEGTYKEVVENSECLCIPSNAELPLSDNKDNEVDLVKEFFAFYSESVDWDTDALYMKDATVFPRNQIAQDPHFIGCKSGCMTIIDPFVLTHNVAANINEGTKCKFVTELKRAAELTRDWPTSAHKLESGPWGVADQMTGKQRKRSAQHLAAKSNTAQGKNPDVAGNVHQAPKMNSSRIEGEQENGEFCITVQPVSQSLTCTQLLLTAKQNNVTPAEQWCNMAQDLILNVLKSVFMVEVKELRLSEEERKEKLGQDVESGKGSESKPPKDLEMKNATSGKDGKEDYVLVDVCDDEGHFGQTKDESSGYKRSRDEAHLDGTAVATDPAAGAEAEHNAAVDAKVGNPKKFCEGIANSVDQFEEVILTNLSTENCSSKVDGNDSSNACTDDFCMELAIEGRNGFGGQDTTGSPSASAVAEASADVSTKDPSSYIQTTSTSSGPTEARPSKVFTYACSCHHQVWVDRKKVYSQIPQKENFTALALEQEVTKLVLARKDLLLQKINAVTQGVLESSKTDSQLHRSQSGQHLQNEAVTKGLARGEDLRVVKIAQQVPQVKQQMESSSEAEKSKKIGRPDLEFSCQIVYQSCDDDLRLPYIVIKLKPSLSSCKQFRNFFSAFRSLILRVVTQHFLEMSS
ncbi:unnamed protein product [Candidula unifasciata]|uniref:RRM domain-containing protein n=1 Tax=Candidula unifasciata TaxID=100452 RepID=A0A8S3ZAS9_9EUPU|nr:unnamed protein product [Candidula unifasciata]